MVKGAPAPFVKRSWGHRGICHQRTEDCGIKMKWFMGSGDSKAAETQAAWPRALPPEAFLHHEAITSPDLHERKCHSACCLHKQYSGAQLCQRGPGGGERVKTQSCYCLFFPYTSAMQEQPRPAGTWASPACVAPGLLSLVSSFPYPSGGCGPHLLLFADFSFWGECKQVSKCMKPLLPSSYLQGIVPPLRW